MRKRVMTPAVDEMTVKEERACLSEIRENNSEISHNHRLQNGWTAGYFALKYVTGHYRKRKGKETNAQHGVESRNGFANCTDVQTWKKEESSYISDPFAPRPVTMQDTHTKQSKRTQRYRSTAKSRILGMTVGDIRYCFQQLRSAGEFLTPDFVLYNGQCSGEFALCYLIETSNSMRSRRKRETNLAKEQQKAAQVIDYPISQLPQSCISKRTQNGKVTFD